MTQDRAQQNKEVGKGNVGALARRKSEPVAGVPWSKNSVSSVSLGKEKKAIKGPACQVNGRIESRVSGEGGKKLGEGTFKNVILQRGGPLTKPGKSKKSDSNEGATGTTSWRSSGEPFQRQCHLCKTTGELPKKRLQRGEGEWRRAGGVKRGDCPTQIRCQGNGEGKQTKKAVLKRQVDLH